MTNFAAKGRKQIIRSENMCERNDKILPSALSRLCCNFRIEADRPIGTNDKTTSIAVCHFRIIIAHSRGDHITGKPLRVNWSTENP